MTCLAFCKGLWSRLIGGQASRCPPYKSQPAQGGKPRSVFHRGCPGYMLCWLCGSECKRGAFLCFRLQVSPLTASPFWQTPGWPAPPKEPKGLRPCIRVWLRRTSLTPSLLKSAPGAAPRAPFPLIVGDLGFRIPLPRVLWGLDAGLQRLKSAFPAHPRSCRPTHSFSRRRLGWKGHSRWILFQGQ